MTQMASKEAYRDFYQKIAEAPNGQIVHFNPVRMRHFTPRAGASLLELGCGSGGNLVVFGKGFLSVGVELAPTLVNTARRALRARGILAEVIEGWIEDFHDPRRFDYVVVTEVLEHVFDPVAILKVAREHLAEDGEVFISAPSIRVGGASHIRGVPYADLEMWLKEADLKPIWHIEQPNRLKDALYQQTLCKAVAA